MAKAEPWEKHSSSNQNKRKHVLTLMAIHNLHRQENKDIKKIYSELDPKRRKRYMEILSDSVPKDINVHEMEQAEKHLVDQEWIHYIANAIRPAAWGFDPAPADPAAAGDRPDDPAPADPAAAGDRPEDYADSDDPDDDADSDHEH